MDYIQLTLDDYIQCKTEIKENLGGIVKSFVRIGWQLTRINASQAYKNDGYNSITEFAKAEYDMNPDGVSRFMSVYERYSLPGDTPELQEQYKDFKFAQLSEMLQLPQEDLSLIGPETKRADIRELKKFNKENENNPENLMNWKQEPKDALSKTILEFFKTNKDILNELYGSEAYQTGNLKEMAEIVNPSGNKMFHKGTVFLAFYNFDKGIMVKEFGQSSPYDMTWEKFFSITQSIFAESAAGVRTWENYFEPESQKITHEEKETENELHSEEARMETKLENSENPEPETEKGQKTALDETDSEGETKKMNEKPETAEPKISESQKTAHKNKCQPDTGNFRINSDFAPAQKAEELEEKSQETAQIPGQDTIENHPEYMPEPQDPEKETTQEAEIAPAQTKELTEPEHDVLDKPIARKEYIDTLTSYGTAEYLAKAMGGFRSVTYSRLQEPSFWETWLEGKVDCNGRPWID
ncbi:MAG: hypothetical protein Q4F21_14335 [Lachnospiraceae bacterium]|nr:hypothetical protein [Lachnospiraceae bacterium]